VEIRTGKSYTPVLRYKETKVTSCLHVWTILANGLKRVHSKYVAILDNHACAVTPKKRVIIHRSHVTNTGFRTGVKIFLRYRDRRNSHGMTRTRLKVPVKVIPVLCTPSPGKSFSTQYNGLCIKGRVLIDPRRCLRLKHRRTNDVMRRPMGFICLCVCFLNSHATCLRLVAVLLCSYRVLNGIYLLNNVFNHQDHYDKKSRSVPISYALDFTFYRWHCIEREKRKQFLEPTSTRRGHTLARLSFMSRMSRVVRRTA